MTLGPLKDFSLERRALPVEETVDIPNARWKIQEMQLVFTKSAQGQRV